MSDWDVFDPEDFALFDRVAKSLRRRAHGLLEQDDLYQSCALWALENQRKFGEAKDKGEAFSFRLLHSRMADLIRAERARTGGWEPEDEWSYTPKMLKQIVPLTFDPTWMEKAQEYSTDPKTKGGDPGDPASAWVLVADVKDAFPKLREQDRLLLYKTLVGPGEYVQVTRDIATEAGVTPKVVQDQVRNALGRLARLLRRD